MSERKRRRTTIVCNICKARKVRCDRNLPCNSCIKHKSPHLCSYDEIINEPVLKNIAPDLSVQSSGSSSHKDDYLLRSDSEHQFSRVGVQAGDDSVFLAPTTPAKVLSNCSDLRSVIGVNPIGSPHDAINFHLGYSSISFDPETLEESNHGPFSWHSIVRVDPGLSLLWNFMLDIKPGATNDRPPSIYTKSINFNQKQTQLQVLHRIRKQLVQKFDPKNTGLHWKNLPLGLTFNDPNSHNENIGHEDRLLGILPLKKIILSHINRFFRILYPFFPYLDEQLFRETITRILGNFAYDDTKVTKVTLTGRMDDAHLGILCILLRLSYLSLISNDVQKNKNAMELDTDNPDLLEIKMLLLCPIGIEFVDFARICLNQYQVCNRSSLVVLQLIVFTRIYMELSPEDSEGPARDMYQVNNGVLLQMANSIGLNREPDKMSDTLNDPKINNVRRKLWTFVQFRDVVNSLKFGSPFISAAFASDTNFPYLDDNNSNCETRGIDVLVDRAYRPLEQLLPLMKNVIKNVLQIDKGTLMVELLLNLNNLEVYLYENYGTIRDVSRVYLESSEESIERLIHLPYYVPIQVFIISVYFRLFLYYENSKVLLAYFYCKKMMMIITQEFLPYVNDMLDKPHPFFHFASQLVINPQLEYFLHRSVGFFSAFTIRLGSQVLAANAKGLGNEPNILKLKFLMRSLSRCSKASLMGIHKMNHRYCYAWRIGTTFTYILRSLVSEGFYERIRARSNDRILLVNFDDYQINDLINLLQPLIERIDLSGFGIYWNIVHDVIQLGKPASGKEVLFNPMNSRVVFEGLPKHLNDIGLASTFDSPSEIGIDSLWFPVFDVPKDLNNVMGTFFEGPESYFEAFNNAATNQTVLDNYGIGGAII